MQFWIVLSILNFLYVRYSTISASVKSASTTEFYTVYEADLTEAEIVEYLTYKKLSMLRTIQNCILVLTVSSIIYMVVSIFV